MASTKRPTATIEEYLESIVNLLSEGKAVLAARLADRLGLTRATVSATLRRMERDGLISTTDRSEIILTNKGRKLAVSVVRRHRLAERLLVDVLGIEWHVVNQEACLFEHAISAKVEEQLYKILSKPTTCPHGNPIPIGDTLPVSEGVPLSSIAQGTTVLVKRIGEEATRNPELMEHLHRNGIIPGTTFVLKEVTSCAGTLTLTSKEGEVTLGMPAAESVWVTPENL